MALNRTFRARTASTINLLLGLWLIASPWVFGFSGKTPVLNSALVGALIAMFAALRLTSLHASAGVSGITSLLGFWTIVSPWANGYAANRAAVANSIMVGVFVTALAIWGARRSD
jgi:hypothetical protein